MLNIVVPMAGHGSRFSKAGYALPKPLIPVHGVPMIRLVIANLTPKLPHRFIFICQEGHLESFPLEEQLREWAPGCEIRCVRSVTEGAACTVLLARDLIDNDMPLMIANCDQYVEVDINRYIASSEGFDGYIMTMVAADPKWSFVGFNSEGGVCRVVEKEVISNEATVGIYNFARGRDFVMAADEMIANDLRVNGEFYVAPTYNQMITRDLEIGTFSIGSVEQGMHGLGIPSDLDAFLALEISHAATVSLK